MFPLLLPILVPAIFFFLLLFIGRCRHRHSLLSANIAASFHREVHFFCALSFQSLNGYRRCLLIPVLLCLCVFIPLG